MATPGFPVPGLQVFSLAQSPRIKVAFSSRGGTMGKQDDVPGPGEGALSFLAAPGALGGLIGAFGWAATPLGPLSSWPQSLRTSVSLILNTGHPMWIGWGPD